jgi:hypothetical protein
VAALGVRELAATACEVLRGWSSAAAVKQLEAAARENGAVRRRALALQTLGRTEHRDAVRVLLSFTFSPSEDVQRAALRALIRQRLRGKDVSTGRALSLSGATAEVKRVYAAELLRAQLLGPAVKNDAGEPIEPERLRLAQAELSACQRRAEARLFGWLSLVCPPEDMQRAQVTLQSDDRKARAFALEVLEQQLEPSLRKQVLPLVAQLPAAEREKNARAALGLAAPTLADLLSALPEPCAGFLCQYLGLRAVHPHKEEQLMSSVLETMFVLRNIELFSQLSSEELRAVAALAEVQRLPPGSVICREGEPGDAFYVLLRGEARVSRSDTLLATLHDGECFGELALLDRGVRKATVTTHGECELARIRADDFNDLLEEAPSIARAMLGILARRTAGLLEQAGKS